MKIVKAIVVVRPQGYNDHISLVTDVPGPFKIDAEAGGKLVFSFNAERGTGADYVRNNFGLEPEVLNT